jgi:NADPH2 dehydrogenase
MTEPRLFKPLRIGHMELKHRIAMAPLTRFRATDDRVPTQLMKEYYSQRASTPGTLIISEGTFISPTACGGFARAPGIWSKEQITGWRMITEEVHRKGCYIFCQLFASGRAADVETAKKEGVSIVAPSAIPIDTDSPTPRAMTIEEIKQMIEDFAIASENAIVAGFDGVECHGANGYLFDQFNQDVSNQRNDEYGGSVENRSRFINDLMKAAVDAIGPERVGLRLSPWSTFQSMKMKDPIPQFTDIIDKAGRLNLAYLSLVESRVAGSSDYSSGTERLDFAYKSWNRPFLIAGGYNSLDAQKLVEEEHPNKDIVVVFGRYFLANPDLVWRIKESLELTAYNRETFYSNSAVGYVDYPFSAEYLASKNIRIG